MSERSFLNHGKIPEQAPVGICVLRGSKHVCVLANDSRLPLAGALDLDVLDEVYRTGKPYISEELEIHLPQGDGKLKKSFFNFVYQPWFGRNGRPRGVVVVVSDVSKAVESKNRIAESESRFRKLSDLNTQMVWVTDPGGRLTYVNDRWLRVTGLSLERVEDHWCRQVMHPEDVQECAARFEGCLRSGEDYSSIARIRRASDGEYLWHLNTARAIRDSLGNVTSWIGSSIDIHAQQLELQKSQSERQALSVEASVAKQEKDKIQRLNEVLQEERSLRELFVATLTHDLRSPIAAGKIRAELIFRRSEDSLIQSHADRIMQSLNRVDEMVQNLLDANRIRAGEKLFFAMKPVDLARLLRVLIADMTTLYGERFKTRLNHCGRGVWNAGAIRRVLENLISNAVKYGSRSEPISIEIDESAGWTAMRVINFGNPISEENQKRIFQSYQRLHQDAEAAPQGWGLGLSLVKGVMEAHCGTVEVESGLEKGTIFTLRLPTEVSPGARPSL